MLSNINISGFLTNVPEIRYTESNLAVALFCLVFESDNETEKSLKCSAYGKLAETIASSLKKGDRIVISGVLLRAGDPPKPAVQVSGFEKIN